MCLYVLQPYMLFRFPLSIDFQGFQVAEMLDLFPPVLPALNLYGESFRFFSLANWSFSYHIRRLGLDFWTLI